MTENKFNGFDGLSELIEKYHPEIEKTETKPKTECIIIHEASVKSLTKMTPCVCPNCEKPYSKKMDYTGKLPAKMLCPSCKKLK